tara:strand:- start:90 stop:710 length:621 start_codon:yes stop_codon:yes gene_type:complete
MTRLFTLITFLIDIAFVIAIWVFDLNPGFILSIMIVEIFLGFGFFGGMAIIKTTLADMQFKYLALILVFLFQLWLLNIFHSFIPPGFSYTTNWKVMMITEDYWYIISYVALTVFILCKLMITGFIEDKDETRAKVLLSRVVFMFYRMLVFSLTFALLMPFFAHTESRKILPENVDDYIKTAVTVIVISFSLLDLGAERKMNRLKGD